MFWRMNFILSPAVKDLLILEKKYITNSLYNKPTMAKFIDFINYAKLRELKNLGIFCTKVYNAYSELVLLQ